MCLPSRTNALTQSLGPTTKRNRKDGRLKVNLAFIFYWPASYVNIYLRICRASSPARKKRSDLLSAFTNRPNLSIVRLPVRRWMANSTCVVVYFFSSSGNTHKSIDRYDIATHYLTKYTKEKIESEPI